MASINYAAREISVKIVYYGPGLSGKTTNLQIIHKKVPKDFKSDMVSLATETDRTLFFDFLPLDLGKIKGFSAKFQLYTVPGQVYYNATRKLVLRGVDGVVFVADSAQDKIQENIESFQNLMDNLAEYGYKREQVPLIIQYNKRDLPNALSIQQIDPVINKYNVPWTEASAIKGQGVFESLKLIGKIVIDELNRKYSRNSRSSSAPQAQMPPRKPSPPTQPQGMPQRAQGDLSQQRMGRPQMPPQQHPSARPAMPQAPAAQQQQWGAPKQNPATPPPPPMGQAQQPFSPPPPPRQQPRHFTPPPPPPAGQQRQPFAQQPMDDQIPPINRQPVQGDPFMNPPIQNRNAGQNQQQTDYSSLNLEPMNSSFNANNSFAPEKPNQQAKSELDLEIERYQQEIYSQGAEQNPNQYDYRDSQQPYESFELQKQPPYNPNDYQSFDPNQSYNPGFDQNYDANQNYNSAPGAYNSAPYTNDQNSAQEDDGEATFEIEPPSSQYSYGNEYSSAQQQNQNADYYQNQNYDNSYGYDQTQYEQPRYEEPPENNDKPMYFTSVDMDHPPKKGKKPVNPKNKPKKGFFGRFRKNEDEDFL